MYLPDPLQYLSSPVTANASNYKRAQMMYFNKLLDLANNWLSVRGISQSGNKSYTRRASLRKIPRGYIQTDRFTRMPVNSLGKFRVNIRSQCMQMTDSKSTDSCPRWSLWMIRYSTYKSKLRIGKLWRAPLQWMPSRKDRLLFFDVQLTRGINQVNWFTTEAQR